jgi:hypothetical protein
MVIEMKNPESIRMADQSEPVEKTSTLVGQHDVHFDGTNQQFSKGK